MANAKCWVCIFKPLESHFVAATQRTHSLMSLSMFHLRMSFWGLYFTLVPQGLREIKQRFNSFFVKNVGNSRLKVVKSGYLSSTSALLNFLKSLPPSFWNQIAHAWKAMDFLRWELKYHSLYANVNLQAASLVNQEKIKTLNEVCYL